MGSYLDVLEESLKKKIAVLDRVQAASSEQGELLQKEQPDMERFDRIVAEKDDCIAEMEKLDEGFEALYDRIREELLKNRAMYAEQIKRLQELIGVITDKSVAVQAQEARNRDAVSAYFGKEKQALGKNRKSAKAAYGYYKSMDKAIRENASYMDMKK